MADKWPINLFGVVNRFTEFQIITISDKNNIQTVLPSSGKNAAQLAPLWLNDGAIVAQLVG
jgi:hypothetical protein